jgi:hypothetical protein
LKITALASVAALALSGCAGGQLTPAAQADIQSALDAYCPTVAALQPNVTSTFNGNVATAYNAVLLACPPNPAPTNPVVIGMDILDAIAIIKPYLKNVKL